MTRRGALLLATLPWALSAAGVRAQEPAPLFVEVDGVPQAVWVHEAFEVVVRVGCDREWLASGAVPLFQQPLDRPFHVVVPWLLAAEDRAVELLPAAGAGVRVAVGDRVVAMSPRGERTVGGRAFELLELRCRWLPLAAGTSLVAPVQVRYAYATAFTDDFLRGRQPVDRQEGNVASGAGQLAVRALPGTPPPGFCGAVGELEVQARVERDAVRVGESFVLVLEVQGEGNVDRFAPPPPPPLPGFHVEGVVDRGGTRPRRFELDVLALRAGASEVPPIPFVAFAPARGDYVTLRTQPVRLRVEPPAPGAVLSERVQQLVAADAREVAAANAPSWWWAVAAGLAAVAAHTGLRLRRRRTQRSAALRRARDELAAAAGADAGRQLAAFEALLAAAAGVPTWTPLSWPTLAARGVAPARVAKARDVHAALDAARFGGIGPALPEVLAAADELAGR